MSTENNTTNNNQEIDLLELFQSIGRGIRNFFVGIAKGLAFLIVFGIKKWYFMVAFIILGIVLGTVSFNTSKRYYASDMEAKTNGINSADMIGYINNLHELCEDGNKEALAQELEMEDTVAAKIKDIQSFFIVDLNMDEIGDFVDYENEIDLSDTTQRRLPDRIHISVEVFDNKAFSEVREGLLRYMRNNPYLLKLNELRVQELKELIYQTNYEIAKLDSLQNTDYFSNNRKATIPNNAQMMVIAEKEPTMYYEYKFRLIEQKHKLQRELLLTSNSFTVIKDFTSLTDPENPKSKYIIKYLFFTVLIGYFSLLLIANKGKLQDFINS